jgi:hypothetical protein
MSRGKKQVNGSQAIRGILNDHPALTAKEVVGQLAQRGVTVRPSLVYMVKGSMRSHAGRRRRKAARLASVADKSGIGDPVALIRDVKLLADRVGGMRNLRELVTVLASD